jgi:predicted Rossmann fold flavoprotein
MRIGIIGGGAAGMMATATINEQNPNVEVFLIERNNTLGKKVIISGGGRCNVTTGLQDIQLVLEKYPRGSKFLSSAMWNFPPSAVVDWFINQGVSLYCEEDMRIFPISNQGKDIVKVFEKLFLQTNTKLLFTHNVQAVKKQADGFMIEFKDQPAIKVDKVILTLGGQAYRQTGSTGDGYALAESLGHQITALAPSLSSLICKETWPQAVAGVSFHRATLKIVGQKKYKHTGSFVFTHWGLSGPAVFALSSLIAFEQMSDKQPLNILVDITPDQTSDELLMILKKFIHLNPHKTFKYTLQQIMPLSLSIVVSDELRVRDKKNCEISQKELRLAVEWCKQIPLTIISRRTGDEFVTAGGVNLKEVNPNTMESKICPGLFFAGEILDIDGFTGGFNLQASWATGRLAGIKSCTF